MLSSTPARVVTLKACVEQIERRRKEEGEDD
jgi:hypothetical protein